MKHAADFLSGELPARTIHPHQWPQFEVVGVYQRKVQDGDDTTTRCWLSPSVRWATFMTPKYISGIFMDYEGENHQQLTRVVRSVLAGHHNFRPDDRRAYSWPISSRTLTSSRP